MAVQTSRPVRGGTDLQEIVRCLSVEAARKTAGRTNKLLILPVTYQHLAIA